MDFMDMLRRLINYRIIIIIIISLGIFFCGRFGLLMWPFRSVAIVTLPQWTITTPQ